MPDDDKYRGNGSVREQDIVVGRIDENGMIVCKLDETVKYMVHTPIMDSTLKIQESINRRLSGRVMFFARFQSVEMEPTRCGMIALFEVYFLKCRDF